MRRVKGVITFATVTVVELQRADDSRKTCSAYVSLGVEFMNEDTDDFIRYLRAYPKAVQTYELTIK